MLLLSSWAASFWCDEHVDGKLVADGGKIALQPSRVADAAFRVIYETEERGASFLRTVSFNVDTELIHEVLGAQAGPRFLDDNRQSVSVQEEGRTRCTVCITGGPFVGADIVELDTQEGMEQILHIHFVLDSYRGSIFPAEPQLTRNGMKPPAEFSAKFKVIDRLKRRIACDSGGWTRHRTNLSWLRCQGNFLRGRVLRGTD